MRDGRWQVGMELGPCVLWPSVSHRMPPRLRGIALLVKNAQTALQGTESVFWVHVVQYVQRLLESVHVPALLLPRNLFLLALERLDALPVLKRRACA